MKHVIPFFVLILAFTGCLSVLESNRASEEIAWELSYQLKELSGLTVAVGDFETTDVPDTLKSTFRNDLSTSLAIDFRYTDQDHKVVTRDKVDEVFAEQSMSLEGLTYQETQIRIGQVLGAEVLVVGTIILLGDDLYRASTQLLETETGVIIGGSSLDFWFDTESE